MLWEQLLEGERFEDGAGQFQGIGEGSGGGEVGVRGEGEGGPLD